MSNGKNALAEIAKLIPEAGFDLICRVTPGVIIVVAFCHSTSLIGITELSWHHLVIGAFFAYLAGMVLDSFVSLTTERPSILLGWRVYSKYVSKKRREEIWNKLNINLDTKNSQDTTSIENDAKTDQQNNFKDYEDKKKYLELFREYIREINPSQVSVLVKIESEERLMKNTAVGLPLGIIIIFLKYALEKESVEPKFCIWQSLVLLSLLVGIEAVLIFGAWYRIQRTMVWQIRLLRDFELKEKEYRSDKYKENVKTGEENQPNQGNST